MPHFEHIGSGVCRAHANACLNTYWRGVELTIVFVHVRACVPTPQVDKRVTTPYWDFTIEGEAIYKAGWGPKALLHVSQMFTDTWYEEGGHV